MMTITKSVFGIGAGLSALVAFSSVAEAQISSGFGARRDPFTGRAARHAGIDLPAGTGVPVYATGDGFVSRARRAGGYGNLVELNNGNGYQTRFGHLSKIFVGEGQMVRRGQMIGAVGSTGRSTGAHLHYEVRIAGRAVDPRPYGQIVFANTPNFQRPVVQMASLQSGPQQGKFVSKTYQKAGTIVLRYFDGVSPGSPGITENKEASFGSARGGSLRPSATAGKGSFTMASSGFTRVSGGG